MFPVTLMDDVAFERVRVLATRLVVVRALAEKMLPTDMLGVPVRF